MTGSNNIRAGDERRVFFTFKQVGESLGKVNIDFVWGIAIKFKYNVCVSKIYFIDAKIND